MNGWIGIKKKAQSEEPADWAGKRVKIRNTENKEKKDDIFFIRIFTSFNLFQNQPFYSHPTLYSQYASTVFPEYLYYQAGLS